MISVHIGVPITAKATINEFQRFYDKRMQAKSKKISWLFLLATFLIPGTALFTATPSQAQRDRGYCDRYARDYANRHARGGALRGAGRGAAGGAIFGAIAGNAGRGAAIGSAVGALGGGIRRSESKDRLYQRAYDDCMRRDRY